MPPWCFRMLLVAATPFPLAARMHKGNVGYDSKSSKTRHSIEPPKMLADEAGRDNSEVDERLEWWRLPV
jgi:hypothetical protein